MGQISAKFSDKIMTVLGRFYHFHFLEFFRIVSTFFKILPHPLGSHRWFYILHTWLNFLTDIINRGLVIFLKNLEKPRLTRPIGVIKSPTVLNQY